MIRVKSHYALYADNRSAPELKLSPLRRIGFAFSALLLLTAAIMAFPQIQQFDFSFGTLFYIALFVACFVVAGMNRRCIFDLDAEKITYRSSFLGFRLSESTDSLKDLESVRLTALRMIGNSARPSSTVLNAGFGSYVEKRKMYYRLELVFSDKVEKIDDGSDGADINATAKTLASLINRPFIYKEG
ncbi:hypothetical protein [Spirochaeta dissipatitropha]